MTFVYQLLCGLSFHFPRNEIAESYGDSIFNLRWRCQTVSHSGRPILCSHRTREPLSVHILAIVCFAFFNLAVQMGVKWYLVVVLIYISLETSAVQYLVVCLWLGVCLFWGHTYSGPLLIFKLGGLSFCG